VLRPLNRNQKKTMLLFGQEDLWSLGVTARVKEGSLRQEEKRKVQLFLVFMSTQHILQAYIIYILGRFNAILKK
jgi:hypothetical protein